MPISGPSHAICQQDRFLACEEDLEAEFQQLIARAVQAGWDEAEACAAIASLADHHVLSMLANRDLSERIASGNLSGIVLRRKR